MRAHSLSLAALLVSVLPALAEVPRPQLPPVKPLFDFPLRDPSVCLAPDGFYYLTGTTGYPTWWETNDGIRIWKSRDLRDWTPLGLVWSFGKEGAWNEVFKKGRRALWAPEIHFLKGTFWLTYSLNYGGTGLLKSTTGKAEGPYAEVQPGKPMTEGIDASLFQDDDGTVYFVYQNGQIARMKGDMSGLAEKPRLLKPQGSREVGFEGAFLFKTEGRYFLAAAEFVASDTANPKQKTYDCMVASAKQLRGPYGPRRLVVPHGGHNMFFRDRDGNWWATLFGGDERAPFRERPAMLRVKISGDGGITLGEQ